ncbi:MAG: RdgB/HAM1 family non-canonical purine NTP pyrophosphatase [Oscillospiraceae bacterium]|nr:RdgB/HAM1 family non-canonical purine NTP pyrophosphatase [Oscillospiraceae bacterium]
MKLAAATSNPHKLEEFRAVLAPMGIEVISAAEAGFTDEIEETGDTFAENAAIKARALFKAVGLPVFADDSGLCVDALGGRPGVYSARYGGDIPHTEKIALLLSELEGVPPEKRAARFVCVIHCILEDGREIVCEGACEGMIGFAPAGIGGFGYDPIFFRGKKSMAQISAEEKHTVSHRGKALRDLARILAKQAHPAP